ncbi:MAG TPA: YdeI/OmpD-associated family protein [Candidatus Saccharimonadales bacterium]|nr:YdeI/OmpD-associated family protein [Candidatus Saccharimonadales bacterium]
MSAGELNKVLTELNAQMAKRPVAKVAFEQLPPERKHEILHFLAEEKKPQSRARRIENSINILETWWAGKNIVRK